MVTCAVGSSSQSRKAASISQKAKFWKELVGGVLQFPALGVTGLGLGNVHQTKGRGGASTQRLLLSPCGLAKAWCRGASDCSMAPLKVHPSLSTGQGQAEEVPQGAMRAARGKPELAAFRVLSPL